MTRYLEQAKIASEARLILAVDRLIVAQNDMRYLPSPRALLESALVHICRPEDTLSITNLEARLDRLEAMLKDGIPARTQPSAAPAPKEEKKPESKPEPKPVAQAGRDEAPWASEPPPEEYAGGYGERELPKDHSPKPAPKPEPKPEPKHAPAASAAGSDDATTIWRETIANIPNMFVQVLAREAVAIKFDQNTLTIGFTEAQEMKHKSLSAPINFEPTQRALQAIKPEAKLVITTTKATPASGQAEELAKALFGDKLTIE